MSRLALLLIAVVATRLPLAAQSDSPRFEVMSIKRNLSPGGVGLDGARTLRALGAGFEMIDGSALALIRYAYPTLSREVQGAPSWAQSDRFDVRARSLASTTRSELEQMIRGLLADRFALRVHYETVDRPIYNLVVARADGTLGPSLKRTARDCDELRAARKRGDQPPPLPANPTCSWVYGGGSMVSGGVPIADLVRIISIDAGRVVVDKTGLAGDYEFELVWNPIPLSDAKVDRPSLFVAVEEQLGMKLEPAHGPVEIVVIDRIERPTPD